MNVNDIKFYISAIIIRPFRKVLILSYVFFKTRQKTRIFAV